MTRSFAQLPGFEMIHRIGKGAGAVIYSATQADQRRKVAVKHVVRHNPRDDRLLEQAENEFEVSRNLKHPFLRRSLDMIRVRRWLKTRELFLIMELVDGQRLDELYAAERPRDYVAVTRLFGHVAEGLQALHQAGFAHADIKPNNILIESGGLPKIIDFGQSCRLGHTKERIQGTPDYIAPEQVSLGPIDQRTDIYNLGATMYWLVTGRAFSTVLPYAPTGMKKIELEGRRANDPPHELISEVPLPLSRLIMECCEHDKEARPRDMARLAARLETVMHVLRTRPGS